MNSSMETTDSIAALLCSMSKGRCNLDSSSPLMPMSGGVSNEVSLQQQQHHQQPDIQGNVASIDGADWAEKPHGVNASPEVENSGEAAAKRRHSPLGSLTSSVSSSDEEPGNRKMPAAPGNQARSSVSGYTSLATTAEGISESETDQASYSPKKKRHVAKANVDADAVKSVSRPSYSMDRELLGAPYFYYRNRSLEIDEDPLAPLSQPLCVPNFVIKLHSILIREDLKHVASWMPHGRAWRIVDAEAFEKEVLPAYFKQSNINSFHRQANGWGFRRMLKGPDKGAFYNELFLRGLSHLCKKMKRIGGAKVFEDSNISHEPNLWKISAKHPLTEKPTEDANYIVLKTINECVRKDGPKAKMPFIHDLQKTEPLSSRVDLSISTKLNEESHRPSSNLSMESNDNTSAPNLRSNLLGLENDLVGGSEGILQQGSSISQTPFDLTNLMNRNGQGIGTQQMSPAQLQILNQNIANNQSQGASMQQPTLNQIEHLLQNLQNNVQGQVQQVQQPQSQKPMTELQQITHMLLRNQQQQQLLSQMPNLQVAHGQNIQLGNDLSNLINMAQRNNGQQFVQNPQLVQSSFLDSSSSSSAGLFQQQTNSNDCLVPSSFAAAPSSFATAPSSSCDTSSLQTVLANSNEDHSRGDRQGVEDTLKTLLASIQTSNAQPRQSSLASGSASPVASSSQTSIQRPPQGNSSIMDNALKSLFGNLQANGSQSTEGECSVLNHFQANQDNNQNYSQQMPWNNQDQSIQCQNMSQAQILSQVLGQVQQHGQSQIPQATRGNIDQVNAFLQQQGGIMGNNHSQQDAYELATKSLLSGIQFGSNNLGNAHCLQHQQLQQLQQQLQQQQQGFKNQQQFQTFNSNKWG